MHPNNCAAGPCDEQLNVFRLQSYVNVLVEVQPRILFVNSEVMLWSRRPLLLEGARTYLAIGVHPWSTCAPCRNGFAYCMKPFQSASRALCESVRSASFSCM